MKWKEYMDENPRSTLPTEEMKEFLEYAKKKYEPYSQVNWTSYDSSEDRDDLVKEHIGDSMEALLLFKEFLEKKK